MVSCGRYGVVCYGELSSASVVFVKAKFGMVWQVWNGKVRQGVSPHGKVCCGRFGNQKKEEQYMEFIRRKGFHLKTNPQIVGEVCHSLEKDGKVTPKDLVDASRPKDAPLHNEFEWNDKIASEKYREVQAGYIIRSVAIRITSIPAEVTKVNVQITKAEDEPNVRFYHAIERDGKGFENIETIVTDDEKEAKLMEQCVKDIKYFKEKYIVLKDAMPTLFDAIDKELERIEVTS